MEWLQHWTDQFGAWSWLIVGLALMGLETLAPGFVFLWFGLAAVATGLMASLIGLSLKGQLVAFALLALASLVLWWRLQRRLAPQSADPTLNARAARHIGREFILAEPIISGNGRVRIDDSFWRIAGNDCPEGTKVTVSGVDGSVLTVRQAS